MQLVAAFVWAMPAAAGTTGRDYAGSDSCTECHADIAKRWQDSHHARAMQHATTETVLGDFNSREFTYNGVTSRFFRKDGKFFVRTGGPDGKLAEYEIRYTFGFDPLQQYLVEFPGGRLQALGIAWDTRPKSRGGQRWFHLYPGQKIDHKHPLHWTRAEQNWNYQCGECHVTNIKKNYDRERRVYDTKWSELNVTCEACHGPGAAHVAWAKQPDKPVQHKGFTFAFPKTGRAMWSIDARTGNAVRAKPIDSRIEVETCGRCHARRGTLTDDYQFNRPLLDTHRVALLDRGLYHADGQINDEVYVYGSFLQSRMYHKGVTCSDCHDPHSASLRAPGQKVCLTCHADTKYASPRHHFHKADSRGADCLECHMPTKTYMVVDPRRDHSFRVPRPDLSLALGTPNACVTCHSDKNNQWAADQMKKWYGDSVTKRPSFGHAIQAGRRGAAGAGTALWDLVNDATMPGIARGTALTLLPRYLTPEAVPAINRVLQDPDALVRMAALRLLESAPPPQRLPLAAPFLTDPVRAVRIEAARVLAPVPKQVMPPAQQKSFDNALAEYIAAQYYNAERPESWLNLGLLYAQRGETQQSIANYRTAIELDPEFVPAYVNLADVFRALNHDDDGERLLRTAVGKQPGNPDAQHALGLTLVRKKEMNAALKHLKRAAELQPDNPRYSYVYAIALHSTGDASGALKILERAQQTNPNNLDILFALVTMNLETGDSARARAHLRRLKTLTPDDPRLPQLEGAVTR